MTDAIELTFHQETLRRQREINRRREADAAAKQLVSRKVLEHADSWTAILRVVRRRMVRDVRRLGVETPIYWVATRNSELKAIELIAVAGRNRVRIGRNYRRNRRAEDWLTADE